jgi:hypothetical protein
MSDLALMAATEWARANAPGITDAEKFGEKVAQVFRSCQSALRDGATNPASSGSLSTPSEIPQVTEQPVLLGRPHLLAPIQIDLAGTEA